MLMQRDRQTDRDRDRDRQTDRFHIQQIYGSFSSDMVVVAKWLTQ